MYGAAAEWRKRPKRSRCKTGSKERWAATPALLYPANFVRRAGAVKGPKETFLLQFPAAGGVEGRLGEGEG